MEIVELKYDKNEGWEVSLDGEHKYFFTTNVSKYDEMIEWLYEYTTHRFMFLGTNRIYFEDSNDAAIFKVRWL